MPETDSRLLRAARRGDERSFLALYHLYRTPLFHFAWRLTGSVPAAEDVIQDCFLALLKGVSFDAGQGYDSRHERLQRGNMGSFPMCR